MFGGPCCIETSADAGIAVGRALRSRLTTCYRYGGAGLSTI